MSPLHGQSTTVPLTEELNSGFFWIDSTVGSALREETFRLFHGAATTVDTPPALLIGHLQPSFEDDYLCSLPVESGDWERVGFEDSTLKFCDVPQNLRPEDMYAILFVHVSIDHED